MVVRLCVSVMDNPQPAGQFTATLPVRRSVGASVSLGLWGGAQLALHHLHPVPHRVLEEEPSTVHSHTHTQTRSHWSFFTTEQKSRTFWSFSMFQTWSNINPHTLNQFLWSETHDDSMCCICIHFILFALFYLFVLGRWSTVSTCVTGW